MKTGRCSHPSKLTLIRREIESENDEYRQLDCIDIRLSVIKIMMAQIEFVVRPHLLDLEKECPKILRLMISANHQPRLMPSNDCFGAFESISLRSLNVELENRRVSATMLRKEIIKRDDRNYN